MSNGIKLNFKQSDNEPRAAMLRIVAAGGRACEGEQRPWFRCAVQQCALAHMQRLAAVDITTTTLPPQRVSTPPEQRVPCTQA